MENADVAKVFDEVADLLELQGGNPFRVRAYRNAARTIGSLGKSLEKLVTDEEGGLEELPGIGKDLAGKIVELTRTGRLPLLDDLLAQTPETLVELMHIDGLGPKRARRIYDELGIQTLADLEKAARAGQLHELRGFGKVIEAKVLKGIAEQRARAGRIRLSEADERVRPLLEHLRGARGLDRVEVAGSYRRRRETVGDLDVLAAAAGETDVGERFLSYPDVTEVIARGPTRCAAVLRSGLQVDLRLVAPESWGAALHYFTGSKAHNIAVRALGQKRKLKLNEYGVFRGRRRIGGQTEEEVFAAVGLPWIPPELREDRGEIEAARAGRLPKLIELGDLRGDLQVHTDATDGVSSLEEMVEACRRLGHQYVAITDHSHAVRVARGLSAVDLRQQLRAIERLQERTRGMRILKGAEVDILPDGALDYDDAVLAELDFVLVAVHSHLEMPREEMTRRVCRALAHPRVHALSHPTGRLIGRREPIALDVEAVIAAAREHGVWLEVNAQSDRLDLDDVHSKMARDAGVPLVISSDAHRLDELGNLRGGVDQARRGWCEARDVVNTRPARELMAALRRKAA